ncbi:polyprotein [Poaceae Liege nepovirus A]|uniref:Polyprotein n=1 Tax=Poaceae Liege nepovirus A TaxID=2822470 RepID=A0A8A6U575_9SECO|nr:polyprotein [Poaceae Liege nepovirus A]QTJ95917.1 polyprotein [Poaceae Liege nepovirus A]
MGFAELFASPLGDAARAKAAFNRGLSGWLNATLTTIRAAGPAIQEMAYSALWAEVDSAKELVPLTQKRLRLELLAKLTTAQVRAQQCTPIPAHRYCSCGAHPGQIEFQDGKQYDSRYKCCFCNGTGIIPRSEPMAHIRAIYARQTCDSVQPTVVFDRWVLEDGSESRHATRCRNWAFTDHDDDPVDAQTWMTAAQILFDHPDMRICYPGPIYKTLTGGSDRLDWARLPPSKEMCRRAYLWWYRNYIPGYQEPEEITLGDFTNPRMGVCTIPVAHKVDEKTFREKHGHSPLGNPKHYFWCLEGLKESLEEFDDHFYDCPEPEVTPRKVQSLMDETALYACLVLCRYVTNPTLMAHPDQDEIEEQLDHLENKQGGEIVSTPSFIKMLKEKRKEVRGKEFEQGSEGRLVRSADLELSKKDVFLAHSIMDKFHNLGVVKKFSKSDPKLTKVCIDLTNQEEVIRFPAKELQSTVDGVLSAQTFTVLNRPQFNELNRLAEAGWKEAKSVCLNLHIRSYLPVHLPVYAFCVIMWGHSSNAAQASLSGAYVYLGDQEASVLQLPLVCGYIGKSLEDMEAYQRSLVLSTCFFGTSGLSAGQNMFGITAVEFTEYLPTSYGGITHERESWNQMLKNHQGNEKRRFLAGFNVVDFVEAGKDKQLVFPDFDLQPVPRSQPVVRTFNDSKQPALGRTCSMRVRTFRPFMAGNIPIERRTDNTKTAVGYELGRASVSGTAPRLDDSMCNLKSNGDYAFGETIELPATVAAGTVLGSFNIFDSIQAAGTRVCNEWLRDGYVSHNLLMVSHLAPNSYSGVALWYIFDAYSKIPSDITTTMEPEIARSFGPHIQILREPNTATWLVDFYKMCGQTLNFSGSGYCNPKIWVVAASSVQLARSTAVKFRIEFYVSGERLVRGLAENPLVYPIQATHLRDLNLVLQPRQFALGTYAAINFPISLAEKQTTASGRIVYSYAAGLLSHFLGIGGTIHFVIDVLSSTFVTSKLRVAIWNGVPSTDQIAQMPHVDVTSGEPASLVIQSPFYATANFGSSGASFFVSTLSAPMAPEALETAFEYSIRILGVEAAPQLCREINYKQKFAWFMFECIDSTKSDPIDLRVSSRLVNVTSTKVNVTNFVNAFAIMCATTGMHHGNCILHFSWKWHATEVGKQQGRLSFVTGMGKKTVQEHIGDTMIFNYPQNSFQIPFQFGSFAGPVPSHGNPDDAENWIEIVSPNFSWITSVHVTVEVLDGFKFYGRSAGPLTVPATITKSTSTSTS